MFDVMNINKIIQIDGTTNNPKDAIWNDILKIYNSQQVTGIRTVHQIKSVFDVSKRNSRNDKSDNG